MSLRINSIMRSQITHRLIAHRFDKDEKRLARSANELAMQIYRARYSHHERRDMDALPEGYLPTITSMPVDNRGSYYTLALAAPVRVPFADHGYRVDLSKLKNAEELTAKVREQFNAENALKEKRVALKQETSAAIAGFGTVSRLVDAWPQVKPFIEQLGYDTDKKALPALIPTELNTRLGL
ncbi:MAG: Nmad5 family putative nucleotide modification protein [Rhodanobacter sp.]